MTIDAAFVAHVDQRSPGAAASASFAWLDVWLDEVLDVWLDEVLDVWLDEVLDVWLDVPSVDSSVVSPVVLEPPVVDVPSTDGAGGRVVLRGRVVVADTLVTGDGSGADVEVDDTDVAGTVATVTVVGADDSGTIVVEVSATEVVVVGTGSTSSLGTGADTATVMTSEQTPTVARPTDVKNSWRTTLAGSALIRSLP